MNVRSMSSDYLGHISSRASRELEVDPRQKFWFGSRISVKRDELTGRSLRFGRSREKQGGLCGSEKGPSIVGEGSGREFKGVSCRPTPRGSFSFLVAPSIPSITCTSGCLVSLFLEQMRMG